LSTKYKRLNVKIPEELYERLVETARRRYMSKSDVVRQALIMYLGVSNEAGQN